MRLKTFTAASMAAAMNLVRAEMGDDAIILTTGQDADGVHCRVTAAIDRPGGDGAGDPEEQVPSSPEDRDGYLRQILSAHGVPRHLLERMAQDCAEIGSGDPILALAGAIDVRFHFQPIADAASTPMVLVGVPGAGKTITAAKIAARCRLAGGQAIVASTDTRRAGGIEQLAAFTRILGLDLIVAENGAKLAALLDAAGPRDLAVIDTPGTNPFDHQEMAALAEILGSTGGEAVLVMAAGGDALESADIAAAFAGIGAGRMIVTRLDMTRRLGGLLAAAAAGRIDFAGVSVNPYVAEGLAEINPLSLARLLAPGDANPVNAQHPKAEAHR
ncbi:MAG: hypothetical protein O2944_05675 [Proteobacteria bacterium]|nr:hypothetical protein [Pseudomonadota bacterium]